MQETDRVHSTPRINTSKTTRASQPDPIFAAIDNHRKLVKAWVALSDALDRAESKAKKKHGQRPWSLVAWRNYSAIGGSEIENRREEFLTLPGIDPKMIEKEYLAAKARERAGKRAERAWDKRAGLAVQRRNLDRAIMAEWRAGTRLANTKPRTPAGAAALLAYVKADMDDSGIEWHGISLDTIISTLATWGTSPAGRDPAALGKAVV